MAPWRPLGADLAPGGAFGEALGRHLGPSWRLLGRSWDLREDLLKGIFATGACNAKKCQTNDSQHFGEAFLACFCVAFFVLLAAPARERTLKKQVFAWRVWQFSHVDRLRAERKNGRMLMKSVPNKRWKTHRKRNVGNHQKMIGK